MKTIPFSKIRKTVIIFTLILFAGYVGFQLGQKNPQISTGQFIVNQNAPTNADIDFSLFWDVWQKVHQLYIDRSKIDNQQMVWGAISGMVNAVGDPYTIFLPPKENQEFKNDLSGSFEGIGAQLGQKDGKIIVVAPLVGSPAEKAGIRNGDWIIKVNSEETLNWNITQAVSKIRGPKGTKVVLGIVHETENKPVEITIVRDTIKVPSVESWVKDVSLISEISGIKNNLMTSKPGQKISYIRLNRFGDRLAEDWQQALDNLTASGLNSSAGLIFDLRNNPGGYLDGSVYIASEFIRSGTIVSQVNSDGSRQDYSVDRRGRLYDIPLVVLVNQGSASAAEIVAGALKDYKRAKIIGETTFGKGSVQTPLELKGGSGLHVTTGKWLTPNGDWISEKGIMPDFEITDQEYTATRDAQLAKAIELLLNK